MIDRFCGTNAILLTTIWQIIMSPKPDILVAAGANLPSSSGNAGETLLEAICMLHETSCNTMLSCSRIWSTPAFPKTSGPEFANAVIKLNTSLNPIEFLEMLHRIEAAFGRDRSGGRWSARTLDLDLLAYDDLVLPDRVTQRHWAALPLEEQGKTAPDTIILPHPRLQDRGFVLAPLMDIAPGWVHPVTGRTTAQMFAALPPAAMEGISPYKSGNFPATA